MVVSASINWGKRCPHFLAETRPPFFATSLRANGKNGHARRRGKKNTFFSRPHLSSSGHRRRNLTVSPLSPARRVTTKRGKRETVRGDARVDVRAFFLLGSGPSREKSRVSRKSRHSRRRSPASSAERVVFRGGASLELFAPSVRPRARSPCSRRLRRRNTPAQKIVLEQVFFTNRSLEASWVNSVRSSPRRVVVSAPFFQDSRASRRKMENPRIDAFANVASSASSDGSVERALEATRGRPRRRLRFPRARRRLRRAVGSKFMLSNRQKAGKGFGRTGAACVVVTPRERGGGGGSEARKANAAGIEKRGGGFAGRGGRCHASAARTARIASRDPG